MPRWLLLSYSLLLQFYPPAFRKRFAAEMLELAAAAELSDWAFVFSDTGLAILRCWVQGSPSSAVHTEPDAYMSLGGSSIRSLGLGFVLSTVVLVGLAYVGYRWPPPCLTTKPLATRVVEAADTSVNSAEPGDSEPVLSEMKGSRRRFYDANLGERQNNAHPHFPFQGRIVQRFGVDCVI